MSKLRREEASKWKQILASIPILVILLLGMLVLIPINTTHAYTNSKDADSIYSQIDATSVSSYTLATTTGLTIGDLLTLSITCAVGTMQVSHGANALTYSASVVYPTAITDTQSDIWVSAVNNGGLNYYQGLDNKINTIWTSKAKATSTGTITVTLSGTTGFCADVFQSFNTDAFSIYKVQWTSGIATCIHGATYGGGAADTTCNTNADLWSPQTLSLPKITIPSDSITVGFETSNCNTNPSYYAWGNGGSYTNAYWGFPSTMVSSLLYTGAFSSNPYQACYPFMTSTAPSGGGQNIKTAMTATSYQYYSSSTPTQYSETTNLQGVAFKADMYSQSYSCTVNLVSSTCYQYNIYTSMLFIVFSGTSGSNTTPATIYQNGCSFDPIQNSSTHYVSLISNETYLFYSQTTTSQMLLNFTVFFHSITVYASGDIINLNIYGVANQNAITNVNTLPLMYTYQKTLLTTSTPFKISLGLSIALPNNGQYVFALSSKHDGIQLYAGNLGNTLYIDSTDGYNPTSLTTLGTGQSSSICMYTLTAMPELITNIGVTMTTTVGANTIYVTTYLYSLQGSNGAVAIIQDMTAYLPIWIFPLLLGAWFGLVGLMMGLVISLGMGTAFGIIPLWLTFLLGLGILYAMAKLHWYDMPSILGLGAIGFPIACLILAIMMSPVSYTATNPNCNLFSSYNCEFQFNTNATIILSTGGYTYYNAPYQTCQQTAGIGDPILKFLANLPVFSTIFDISAALGGLVGYGIGHGFGGNGLNIYATCIQQSGNILVFHYTSGDLFFLLIGVILSSAAIAVLGSISILGTSAFNSGATYLTFMVMSLSLIWLVLTSFAYPTFAQINGVGMPPVIGATLYFLLTTIYALGILDVIGG